MRKYSKINYNFWMTLYSYVEKNNFSYSIENNLKKILFLKFLWQECSRLYLRTIDEEDILDIWCDINNLPYDCKTYKDYYKKFCNYLFYASDKMNINRWLYLQLIMNRTLSLEYDEYYGYFYKDNTDIESIKKEAKREFKRNFYKKYKEICRNGN